MNITELARILKVPTQELRDKLPLFGFDIGQKAIKVDNRSANKIIQDWPRLIRQFNLDQEKGLANADNQKQTDQIKKEVAIPPFITVRDFAQISKIPLNQILAELMKNGVFTSLNEKIDFETAAIIGADLNLEIKPSNKKFDDRDDKNEDRLKNILANKTLTNLTPRPPVVVVMGHVDHGKTKLLDAIRETNIVDGEAGGITQHIGAYQVTRKKKIITFIDTPGHEAFAAMRSRGAKIADIAILVIAADDGIKPQTIEAYRMIEAAKIPFVVAINKIDKEEANIEKTKQELANQLKVIPEDWGGKAICVPISAKQGTGIDDLLDMVLLAADMEEDKIKANVNDTAIGTIIESRIDKGEGPVATVLIQNGTLKIGDTICHNGQIYGRVRALKDYLGKNIKQALPATPTKIIGLKIAPQVGDILEVGHGEKIKSKNIKNIRKEHIALDQDDEGDIKIKKINLVIKTDVLGSGEAIEESLAKIDADDVKINIIHKGLGNITEGDIARAEASQAELIGFNVSIAPAVQNLAQEKNITVKIYNIIYELINTLKDQANSLVEVKIERVNLGKIKVLAIFRTENNKQIIGGKIIEDKIENNSLIEVIRHKEIITTGKLTRLQTGKQDVNIAEENQECGIEYEGNPIIKDGDILQIYKEEKIVKKT